VGWEGVFGASILSMLLIPMYFIPQAFGCGSDCESPPGNHFENTPDAIMQLINSPVIMAATFGNVFSIAFFNFFGVSITKYASATTRMVLDSVRTFVIWGFSLLIGWQSFDYRQVIGFVLLLSGTCIYNQVLVIPISFLRPVRAEAKYVVVNDAATVDDQDVRQPLMRRRSDPNDM